MRLLLLACILVCGAASAAPRLLYDLDFGTPPHSVGSPPATGAGPAPRRTISSVFFGQPTVVTSLGPLVGQPLRFLSSQGDQIGLNLTDLPFGSLYCLKADLLFEGEEAGDGFAILHDTPIIRNIEFLDGSIFVFIPDLTPDFPGTPIGVYALGQPLQVRSEVDLASDRWRVYLDGELAYAGGFGNSHSVMQIRLAASGNGLVVGADDIEIAVDACPGTAPEPIAHQLSVDSPVDAPDASPGDGQCDAGLSGPAAPTECTLRAAIMEANALEGRDRILLPPGRYAMTPAGGSLVIRDDLVLGGSGTAAETIVDAAQQGPAIMVMAAADVAISKISIENGDALAGGAIFNSGALDLRDCRVMNNSAGEGGGIYNDGTLVVNGCSILGNSALAEGGGISSIGRLVMNDSEVASNLSEVSSGGGVFNVVGFATIFGSSIRENLAPFGFGGGIDNNAKAKLLLSGSTVHANGASVGGGIDNAIDGRLTMTGVTFSGNEAIQAGGGIDNDGFMDVTNSTISGNSAEFGGGIANFGVASIVSATVVGNSAASEGGGICNDLGSLSLGHSIVASNELGADCGCSRPIASLGFNLDGDGTCGLDVAKGDWPAAGDPGLGPLADNGGLTHTHALLVGSLAMDAGGPACTPSDQRGASRPADGDGDGSVLCDIGAIEVPEPGALASRMLALAVAGALARALRRGVGQPR